MASDKLQLSEYALGNLLVSISSLSSAQRQLLKAAFAIRGSLTEAEAKDMLKHFEEAKLLSESRRQMVLKKLYADKE